MDNHTQINVFLNVHKNVGLLVALVTIFLDHFKKFLLFSLSFLTVIYITSNGECKTTVQNDDEQDFGPAPQLPSQGQNPGMTISPNQHGFQLFCYQCKVFAAEN